MTFSPVEQVTRLPGSGVDFHMHTIASDGAWTPEKLVETAANQGIKIMTVSDHDTLKSVPRVRELAREKGIQFVTGVEITINWEEAMYHLLLFNFDAGNLELNALLDDTQRQLVSKKEYIILELKKLGYKLEKLDHYRRPDGDFLAIDIARALHRGGEVRTFDQALNLCLKFGMQDRICSQEAEKALKVGIAAGGLPVLAHPGRLERGFTIPTGQTLLALKEAGLAGVEAYHPSHKPEEIAFYVDFARKNKLVVSCGSDSHNEARRPMPWNPELCRDMLEQSMVEIPKSLEKAS